jgi:rhodanese-related sulfurtransferase
MPVHRITPEEAVHLLAHDGVDLVDVREPHEWASGHIPGARHVPLGTLLRDPEHPIALKYLQMAQESGSALLA